MKDAKEWMGTLAGNDFDIEKFIRQVQQDAIDTVLSSKNTGNKNGLDDRFNIPVIENTENQQILSSKKDRLYTAEDTEAFAEWIGKNKFYIPFYNPMSDNVVWAKAGTHDDYISTSQLRELWEKEMRKKED